MLLKIQQLAPFLPFWSRSSLVSWSEVVRQTEHTQWDVSWFSQVSFQETWGCRCFFFFPSHSLFWFEIMKHAVEAIWSSVFKRGKIHGARQMPVNLYSCTKFDLVKGCGGGINLWSLQLLAELSDTGKSRQVKRCLPEIFSCFQTPVWRSSWIL